MRGNVLNRTHPKMDCAASFFKENTQKSALRQYHRQAGAEGRIQPSQGRHFQTNEKNRASSIAGRPITRPEKEVFGTIIRLGCGPTTLNGIFFCIVIFVDKL